MNPVHQPQNTITRQDFLDANDPSDPVLVVIFLRGGADGLTLVPPTGDDAYYKARPTLSVAPADAIDLDGYFSLNANLRPLMSYFEAGEFAVIHGAGTEDTTRSHFEAQDTMEHGGNSGSGWLGRFLRARPGLPSALGAVAIGTTRPESLRGAPGGAVMQTLRDFSFGDDDPDLIERLARMYAVRTDALGKAGVATIEAVNRLRKIRAREDPPANGAIYPSSSFGRGLREIARLIHADVGLVSTTIDLNGWDTHFVQSRLIGSLMRDLAGGIDAFLRDLGTASRRVTVVAMTEFGRRLRENTSFGTDHGSGSTMMVIGPGALATGLAGKVTSGWNDLAADQLDEVGDVPAAINYRDILGPVLQAHSPGVDLAAVFPGHTFRTPTAP
ncbi:MAG: DUF1501 domain-containing protein [Phycisphaerales bacterium]